ncbi:tRNA synthetases class I (M)-domain-containing protein [Stachybotrys elegans]|uniref:Probable methionine--tRNA ligase, mitochondrial n=1 Tax=Stachybotrys elegans TaxID=80388 RepID=A0A8K0WRN2_9HYPO|nr:tRNA synthetases class I (M)-domain-containing protein [Stachybotrys elegans]
MRPPSLRTLHGAQQAQLTFIRRCAPSVSSVKSWQVASCRWQSSTSSPGQQAKKPYYITTPIFYVNAAPHIGHLHSMVLADVIKRWEQVKGNEAVLCTGTDEHGMKIQRAAMKVDMDPKDFCDSNANKFKSLAAQAEISNDFFIRTTDPDHKDAVEVFWMHLKHTLPKQLGLYKGVHKGWYCVSDECFYPEDLVAPAIHPQTGRKVMISTETENEVEWVEEETWFFPLTKYKDALLRFYEENPNWITPAHRLNEVKDWVNNHLEDLSVTRPASRLSWGISDPENQSQTIYVWVDALINYLTTTGYGAKWQGPNHDMGIWPADLQIIGKDILRFHAIYWPALLMALGLPLPKRLLCHDHWKMSGRKMSKSLGNVVNPVLALQRWGVDALRYFLMKSATHTKDMGYSNDLIAVAYNKELRAATGNLFQRIAMPRASAKWSIEQAVEAQRDDSNPVHQLKDIETLESHLVVVKDTVQKAMDNLDPAAATRATFALLREANRYISDEAPWDVAKDPSPEARCRLNHIIFQASEALRVAAILMQPIMPAKMTELLDKLGVKQERRTLEWAEFRKDLEYFGPSVAERDVRRPKWDTLFPPALDGDMSDMEALTMASNFQGDKKSNEMNMMLEVLALEARLGKDVLEQFREKKEEKA